MSEVQLFQLGEMRVGMVPMDKLRRRGTNYRKMTDEQRTVLSRSVQRFGMKSFILVAENDDDTFDVIDGHHRWEAGQEAELEAMPVVVLDKNADQSDLAALTFNVSAEIIPEEYVSRLRDLASQFDVTELALDLGVNAEALVQLSAQAIEELNATDRSVVGASDKTSDGRNAPIRVDLVNTEETETLLEAVAALPNVTTHANAIVLALKFARDNFDVFVQFAAAVTPSAEQPKKRRNKKAEAQPVGDDDL